MIRLALKPQINVGFPVKKMLDIIKHMEIWKSKQITKKKMPDN